MRKREWSPLQLTEAIGTNLGVSDWIVVDQSRIDEFARVTLDDQFIHTDPVKARTSAFGGTVAHGFLTLSLMSEMSYQVVPGVRGRTTEINYGFSYIRFLSPVRSGSRIRGRFLLKGFTERKPAHWLATIEISVEIENESKPALVAEWLCMSVV